MSSFSFTTTFLFRPGGLSRGRYVPLVSFTFRMRVIEHVALQTQPLDAGEALGVDWSNATDSADLCKEEEKKKVKHSKEKKKNNNLKTRRPETSDQSHLPSSWLLSLSCDWLWKDGGGRGHHRRRTRVGCCRMGRAETLHSRTCCIWGLQGKLGVKTSQVVAQTQ